MKLGGFIIMLVCMVMFLEFLAVPTGAGVILSSFGVEINPNTSKLDTADLESSTLWNKIFLENAGILFLVGAAGLALIGFFGRGYDTSLVILPIVLFVGTLMTSIFWTTIKYMQGTMNAPSWATNTITMIMIGLGIGFIMACVDYFAGR